jgi:hypothetical protein
MTRTPLTDGDLHRLATIVTRSRGDIPAEGLPPSLLGDLADQIPCDQIVFSGFDSDRQEKWFHQQLPDPGNDQETEREWDAILWQHYWTCGPCSYADHTHDLRSVVTVADFYTVRQWHGTGMYTEFFRPLGFEHELALVLPVPPHAATGRRRTGSTPYVLYVTFPNVPQGGSTRTDEPDPGTCPGI